MELGVRNGGEREGGLVNQGKPKKLSWEKQEGKTSLPGLKSLDKA